MGYVDEVLEKVSKKNADQPEFLQAVNEVLASGSVIFQSTLFIFIVSYFKF